jgi:hypothetical protein
MNSGVAAGKNPLRIMRYGFRGIGKIHAAGLCGYRDNGVPTRETGAEGMETGDAGIDNSRQLFTKLVFVFRSQLFCMAHLCNHKVNPACLPFKNSP